MMNEKKTYAREDVLKFYEQLPFNANENPNNAANLIKRMNNVEYVYPRMEDFCNAQGVLELGCGAGWMSNSIAYYYGVEVIAVDFNPVAINMARETSKLLGDVNINFVCTDLFKFECEPKDIVISNGVLHHTSNALEGVRKCISLTREGGKVFIGLYHKYGRKPFLDYFEKLKSLSLDEDFLFLHYQELDRRHKDAVQARSWFVDQVLHPYETQHTLSEICDIFEEMNVELVCTSINKYEKIDNMETLFEMEKGLYDVGKERLDAHQYYPGFFYVLGERK